MLNTENKSETKSANTVRTRIVRYDAGERNGTLDNLVVEEPLEIAVRNASGMQSLGTAFRTPGDDEALALGMLRSEGVIQSAGDVKQVRFKEESGSTIPVARVVVTVNDSIDLDTTRFQRAFPISAACGACGKSALEALRIRNVDPLKDDSSIAVTDEILLQLSRQLEQRQSAFQSTGGLHAAARFRVDGEFLDLAEDVGRHNAMDKLVGRWLKREEIPWSEQILLFSGRVGYDLMQKALAVRCPVVVSIGAPSSFAVELASLFNLTLVGFLREGRFNVYSAPHRVVFS